MARPAEGKRCVNARLASQSDPEKTRAFSWRAYLVVVGVAALVVLLDQVTKATVSSTLQGQPPVAVAQGLVHLDYVRNTGAAFSLFPGGGWVFGIVAIAVSAGILVLARRVEASPPAVRVALGLVLGGAVGNLADRVRLGYVVDFIDLRWWPVFNVADSAIVVGVILLGVWSVLSTPASSGG